MRIITGKAKGKKLISPDGYDVTRPTLDRVKQSIFNIIQNELNRDSIVLDLFAGTGSLGLESASRGAKKIYLCDKNDVTFSYLEQNIKNTGLSDCAFAIKGEFDVNLRSFKGKEKFDLIFIDPPYNSDYVNRSINLVDDLNILNKNGLIIVKISSSESKFIESKNINLVDYRKYGNTTVCFYRYKESYNE
ncbi:16S rRNA (guanine(966)-N(2))-methyltransferase RsmD [Candidatus Arthromitus sp. SFB-rat-Yit]|uniref:16S rRNA (guanine(966)-N(2))-methyltransferase RsmD n=1 Tax=Candidatus Arthromitus sp. SFB-rat-Yit TaxID=1041504 RepID=UPI000227A65D|nr:16S rRNA (guanine(966)-N(2))-methyltransferase RsmD [Candidatus Arthromitus sp. SFB-rat-Yit]BAK81076.1 methyltransferase [Candidatus Arthromitus sp. SFB-rat-Yit]